MSLWMLYIIAITLCMKIGDLHAVDVECLASNADNHQVIHNINSELLVGIRNYFGSNEFEINETNPAPVQNLSVKFNFPNLKNINASAVLPLLLKQSEVFGAIDVCHCYNNYRGSQQYVWRIHEMPESSSGNGYYSCSGCTGKILLGVEKLDISSCNLKQITSTMFPSNFRVTCVETLNISDNSISSIANNEFLSFKNLKTLDAQHNNLTQITFEVNQLPKEMLTYLSLKMLKADKPCGLQHLKQFIVSYNSLTKFVATDLVDLEYLDLSHNLLNIDMGFVQNLSKTITNLTLSYNKPIVLKSKLFAPLSLLQYLELRGLSIFNIPANTFYGLMSLRTLDLSHNSLTDLPHGILTGLDNITELLLSDNQFYAIDFSVFRTKTLLSLNLANNLISNLNKQELAKYLPMLQLLNVNGNNWNCKDLNELISSLESIHVNLTSDGVHHSRDVSNIDGIECKSAFKGILPSLEKSNASSLSGQVTTSTFILETDLKQGKFTPKTISTVPSTDVVKTETKSNIAMDPNKIPSQNDNSNRQGVAQTDSVLVEEQRRNFALLLDRLDRLQQQQNDEHSIKPFILNSSKKHDTEEHSWLVSAFSHESEKLQENLTSTMTQFNLLLSQIIQYQHVIKKEIMSELKDLEKMTSHSTYIKHSDKDMNDVGGVIYPQHRKFISDQDGVKEDKHLSFGDVIIFVISTVVSGLGVYWFIQFLKRRYFQNQRIADFRNSEMMETHPV